MPRTWLLSGVPRSGTSLSCRLAGELPDTVALSEPFNDRLEEIQSDPRGACVRIGELVAQVQEEILVERQAPSLQVGGRLYDNIVVPKSSEDGLRTRQSEWGRMSIDKPLTDRFTLVIRDNAVFAALLPHINALFPCLAMVRNPLSVLASWQTVNLPVHRGRLPGAELFDPYLHRTLEQEPDLLRRQILALDWLFDRFHAHLPPENVIRYEDLVESGGLALFRRLGHLRAGPVTLANHNENVQYDEATIDALLEVLLESRGSWTRFYRPADCEEVAKRIRHRGQEPDANLNKVPASPRSEPPAPPRKGTFRKAVDWIWGARGRKHAGGSGRSEAGERTRSVWFYREHAPHLTGGHLKHSHYFEHVRQMPGFDPKITFGGDASDHSLARECTRLWPAGGEALAARWEPERRDVLFLEGATDWPYLMKSGLDTLANPRINYIQHVRHAHEDNVRYRYLVEKAIRICVSQEVADAINATGRPRGPVLAIPNGIDLTPFASSAEGSPAGYGSRRRPVTVVGYKSPDLARRLSERLDAERIEHQLVTNFMDRKGFLDLLVESRVAVCLPRAEEGFYLPAIEAMASGCLVVTLDCIGNRGFCNHQVNCLVADPSPESLLRATQKAIALSAPERRRMHQAARATAAGHSLEAERQLFHAVLADIDHLWRTA